MCEINPAHTLVFRLEAFTNNSSMTRERFVAEVTERTLQAEIALNADGKFRFHVHETPVVDPVETPLAAGTYAARTLDGANAMRQVVGLDSPGLIKWIETVDPQKILNDLAALAAVMEPIIAIMQIQCMMRPSGVHDAPTA